MPDRTLLRRSDRATDRSRRTARDPGRRRTSKPATTLERTSRTAILRTCMDTISETFQHCLEEGGDHADPQHLRGMLDAWDVLGATASLAARGSPYTDAMEAMCADVVKACEESCEEFEDDEVLVACADVCREACQHLAA